MKTKQKQLVLNHLDTYGKISSYEAFKKYRVTRLSAVIFVLRETHNIESVWMKGKDSAYVDYTLIKNEKK